MISPASAHFQKNLDSIPQLQGHDGLLKAWHDHFEEAVDWGALDTAVAEAAAELRERVKSHFCPPPDVSGTPTNRGLVLVVDRRALSHPCGWPGARTVLWSASQDALFRYSTWSGVTAGDFNEIALPRYADRINAVLLGAHKPDVIVDCDTSRQDAVEGFEAFLSCALQYESNDDCLSKLNMNFVEERDALARVDRLKRINKGDSERVTCYAMQYVCFFYPVSVRI